MQRAAAILLIGGRSTRMGQPKAALPWGASTLGAHLADVLASAVAGPLVVVRAPGQEPPPLPARSELVEDRVAGRGPLEGLAAGLATVGDRADVAFVSGVDAPLLRPELVRRVLASLTPEFAAAAPRRSGRVHPLAAAYRVAPALAEAQRLLAAGELRAQALLAALPVRWLDTDELLADPALRAADPALDSLVNVNTPEDYAAALRRAVA